ncbi:MAG: hypothetical protein MJY89_01440 [Bacteroidales bacterium]|nr:hypothetical protein [Bacteroidales bacterium]
MISLAAALAVFSSCRKENEEEVKDFMSGAIELSFPEFLHSGEILKFDVDTMTTLARADGDSKRIGYYFSDSFDGSRDTVRRSDGTVLKKEHVFFAPDSLSSFEFSCVGFSDGHYNTSISQKYYVVRDGLNGRASITNFDLNDDDKTFTDTRDGKEYYYTTIGGVDWMRRNLAWEGLGISYKDSPSTSNLFGRFYSHSEAMVACPDGWVLPSEADWVKLAEDLGADARPGEIFPDIAGNLMENIYFNGTRMWEYWPAVKIDNSARFSAIPVGYAEISEDSHVFCEFGRYAMFWSSDMVEDQASMRYIFEDKAGVYFGLLEPEETAMSVRCIRK